MLPETFTYCPSQKRAPSGLVHAVVQPPSRSAVQLTVTAAFAWTVHDVLQLVPQSSAQLVVDGAWVHFTPQSFWQDAWQSVEQLSVSA